MQYTLRNVPRPVDAALRRRAKQEDKSLNEAALDALARGAGVADEPVHFRDLDALAGSWQEDPAFDGAIAAQDSVDRDLWK